MRLVTVAAAALVVACGGSTAPGGTGGASVRLLSSVPPAGGKIDRLAPLRFTFSVPVDWQETQYATCTSGCRASSLPYKFSSTGTEVVGTPLLPPELGAKYTVTVTPLADTPQATNLNFSFSTAPATVSITSDVTTDTTLFNSFTYWIDPAVRIRAKLTIPAGADVAGDLITAGTGSVEAIGTPTARIRISTGTISGSARLSYVDAVNTASFVVTGDVDHSTVYGGRFAGLVMRVAGSLTDSKVSGMIVQSLPAVTERNVFQTCTLPIGGEVDMTAGASLSKWDASTTFANNLVTWSRDDWSGIGISTVFVQTNGGAIRANSFVGLGVRAVHPLAETTRADLSNSWWGTTDMATIFSQPNYNGVVRENDPVVTPVLGAPDPATPTG